MKWLFEHWWKLCHTERWCWTTLMMTDAYATNIEIKFRNKILKFKIKFSDWYNTRRLAQTGFGWMRVAICHMTQITQQMRWQLKASHTRRAHSIHEYYNVFFFNLKLYRWRSVAGWEFEQCPVCAEYKRNLLKILWHLLLFFVFLQKNSAKFQNSEILESLYNSWILK